MNVIAKQLLWCA